MQEFADQIDAYERSSGRFGGGGTDGVRELEMWLSYSLGLLSWLQDMERQLRAAQAVDRAALEGLFDFYQRWYTAASQLLSRIGRMRRAGIAVRHADEFEAVANKGWLQGATPASVREGIEDFEKGRIVEWGKIDDGLCD